MEDVQTSFENEVLASTKAIILEYAGILAQLGIRVDGPEVVKENPGSETSELRVYFWEGEHKIVDAFEFFLVQGGAPVASKKDIDLWICETLEDVVKRRRGALTRA